MAPCSRCNIHALVQHTGLQKEHLGLQGCTLQYHNTQATGVGEVPLYWQSLLCSSQLTQKMQLPAVPKASVLHPWCWDCLCPLPDEISAAGCHVLSASQITSLSMLSHSCCTCRKSHHSVGGKSSHANCQMMSHNGLPWQNLITGCPHSCTEHVAGRNCNVFRGGSSPACVAPTSWHPSGRSGAQCAALCLLCAARPLSLQPSRLCSMVPAAESGMLPLRCLAKKGAPVRVTQLKSLYMPVTSLTCSQAIIHGDRSFLGQKQPACLAQAMQSGRGLYPQAK